MTPEAAANLARCSEETGIPVSEYARWQEAPPPAGMDPDMWRAALEHRGRHHRPWPEDKLQQLSRMTGDRAERQTPAA